MEDKYLEILIEKRNNAKKDLKKSYTPQFTKLFNNEYEVNLERIKLKEEIETYTDCIELYKSIKGIK